MRIITFLTAIVIGAASLWAIPAKPGPLKVTQPDGTELTIFMYGDEHHHYITTEDGYLLSNNGDAYYYAQIDAKGEIKTSALLASPVSMRSVRENEFLQNINKEDVKNALNRQRAKQMQRTPGVGLFTDGKFPAHGPQKVLVILVEYKDRKFVLGDKAHEHFDAMLNKEGYDEYGATGSVRDYFINSSDGQFYPDFDVYGPVTLENKMSYYGGDTMTTIDENAWKMIPEACQLIDDEVDLSQYDCDGDGFIDNVYVYYAGLGQAQGGSASSVWPHSWNITLATKDEYIFDGVKLDHYATSNEWLGNASSGHPDGIGTFVHEFSHVLGLPDLYSTNYNYDAFTPGAWSVMDQGPFNNESRTPPQYSAFEKNALGWLDPVVLDREMSCELPAIENNAAFSIETGNKNEFFLFENRQQQGWDKYTPSHGMLVWHIQFDSYKWSSNSVNNATDHQYVDIEEADNIKTESSRNGDPFPGSAGITSFTDETTPSMKTWSGKAMQLPVTNIKEENGTIKFDVCGGGETIVAGIYDKLPMEERQVKVLEPSGITTESFVAHWRKLNGAEKYEVTITNALGYNETVNVENKNYVEITGLQPETEYLYSVVATTQDAKSAVSEQMPVKTASLSGVEQMPTTPKYRIEGNTVKTTTPCQIYSIDGMLVGAAPKTIAPGIYILRFENSKTVKITVK